MSIFTIILATLPRPEPFWVDLLPTTKVFDLTPRDRAGTEASYKTYRKPGFWENYGRSVLAGACVVAQSGVLIGRKLSAESPPSGIEAGIGLTVGLGTVAGAILIEGAASNTSFARSARESAFSWLIPMTPCAHALVSGLAAAFPLEEFPDYNPSNENPQTGSGGNLVGGQGRKKP